MTIKKVLHKLSIKFNGFGNKIVDFMQERKEKLVLRYLCKVCSGKKTYLISPHDIAKEVCNKVILSVSEIDEIMTGLSLQNYIDFVVLRSMFLATVSFVFGLILKAIFT